MNGTQPNANTTRVDGAVSVNVWLPHHAMYIQSAESIDTVNIATNNFDADTGMAAGAAQTVITKSGTNELRGSAFYFINHDSLNAISYRNDAFDLPKDKIKQETFGGTARRADHQEQAVLLRVVRALPEQAPDDGQLQRADRDDARGRLQRSGGEVLGVQAVQPVHGDERRRTGAVDGQQDPVAI